MKIAYFDAPTGLAGNMILGALLDAGVPLNYLKSELRKLPVTRYSLLVTKGSFTVTTRPEIKHRDLPTILSIIKKSKLGPQVKLLSSRIFRRLAEAEAKVHGTSVNQVHFHEVGAIDAIIDIVGTAICLDKLGIEKVYCSPLPFGKGTIKHAHGALPNPAPATAELLKEIPIYGTNLQGELVTPTGAAIISTICRDYGIMPRIKLGVIGSSSGSKDLGTPNVLRVFIGEAELPTEKDAVLQIETNIDDMDPKLYDQVIAKIMKTGALDASVHPIRMKKKRAAVKLEILCKPEDKDKILNVIFAETTTIGTRVYLVGREKLKREIIMGKKISYLGSEIIRTKKEHQFHAH